MANQPQNTPKGQYPSNTGAKPPTKVSSQTTFKGIKHNQKLAKHNNGMKVNS